MRPFVIGGNWKMHLDRKGSVELATAIADEAPATDDRMVILFPPFPYLIPVARAVEGSNVQVGGQTSHFESSGAYTGAVSCSMLVDAGATVVLVGHSERRRLFGETDAETGRKVVSALQAGLSPMLCVGETLDEREAGQVGAVLKRQVKAGFASVGDDVVDHLLVAYEPVWAIGTGKSASPAEAAEAHGTIRSVLAEMYGDSGTEVPILYGGSVKPHTAAGLLSEDGIDGALVGGASLKAESFLAIIGAAADIQNS